MNSRDSISARIDRGEVTCKDCSSMAIEPVVGWFFANNGDSYCPAHIPLGVELVFAPVHERLKQE